jgi:invasion protein IalB
LPFGVLFQSGVAIRIDDKEHIKFPMNTCLADGCYASLKVDDHLLNQFKSGELMRIGFKNLNKSTLAFNVPLKGFSEAFDSL